jgi:hypothetical protein
LKTIRIGELENGDLFVPTPSSHDPAVATHDEVMRRVAADSDEHAAWMRDVESGRVELIRRDRSQTFVWIDSAG